LSLSGVLALCARILLDVYAEGRRVFPAESRRGETVLAFTFYPALLCLKLAQSTVLVLLGFSGFLYFESRKQYALAGAFLVLAAMKPQLGYLIWIPLFLDCMQTAKWKMLLALTGGIASLSLIVAFMRPGVFKDYLALSQSGYMKIWPSALGGILREPFGASVQSFPLQFLPSAVGMLWFFFYWRRYKANWCWRERMPMLITVSILTSAYGWMFDQVLLLIPVIAIACYLVSIHGKIPRASVRLYTLLNLTTVAAASFASGPGFIVAPLLIVYALQSYRTFEG
jgi:hypothetical protein